MTTCAVCRKERAFRRLYVRDVMRNVLVATHLHVCDRCSRFDQAPKIRVSRKVSEANQFRYDIEDWRLEIHQRWGSSRGPGIVDLPVWDDMTTDEKVLAIIEYWEKVSPTDGCHLDLLKEYVDVKRTTLHMAIKRLIDHGQIVTHVKEVWISTKRKKTARYYRLAPSVDTD